MHWQAIRAGVPVVLLVAVLLVPVCGQMPSRTIKVGVIGVDTSHATEFTKIMNNPEATGPLADCRVVAAYLGGNPEVAKSVQLGEKHGKLIRQMGVEIVDSIDELLQKVDAVMIETLDGRPHLEEAKRVIAAGKPVFIDKPLAGSLADCVEIFQLAKQRGVPCFSSSSLRYSRGIASMGANHNPKVGKVIGCAAFSPNKRLEPHRMPDLFYYGIHGVETLFAIMGPGCKTVTRVHSGKTDLVVGVWKDGRVGTYRSWGGFGATVFGTKGIAPSGGWDGYEPLVVKIAEFFKTGDPPVRPEETLEIYTFLEAADCSRHQGGCPVSMEHALKKAQEEVARRHRRN